MRIRLDKMTMRHYDKVVALWRDSPGVAVSDSDARPSIRAYLRRNRGLSMVAMDGREVVGAILCGHDGRRGLLHHLAVANSHRRRGVGKALVQAAASKLKTQGIRKCWIIILPDNKDGRRFWKSIGWKESRVVFSSIEL
jgi:N-acetylglutamate synthase